MTAKGKLPTNFLRLIGRVSIAATLALFITATAFAQEGKKRVYRWVDEEGNVHYTESLPPDYEGETHDELSHDGIVRDEDVSLKPPPPKPKKVVSPDDVVEDLPRDKSGMKRSGPNISKAEKQQQLDRLLLLRYQNEDELLEARDVEVNQLKYDERLLTASHESLKASLKSNIILAGHRQRAGIEVKPETLAQIANIRAKLAENERSLRGLKNREENIIATFEESLERYRELVEIYSEEDI